MRPIVLSSILLSLFLLSVSGGCEDEDHQRQVAEVAKQAADRQAQQNTEMVRVTREVAEGARRLVEADAEARKEIVAVHHELQTERKELSEGFTQLEAERKEIAHERRTESILLPAVTTLGSVVVATAVIAFCISLLLGLRTSEATDRELNDLLILDLASESPQLLAGPANVPALPNDTRPNPEPAAPLSPSTADENSERLLEG